MSTLRASVPSVLTLVIAISMFPQAGGATPLGAAFTYQGQLQQSGVPTSGTCDMQFSLFDGPGPGGTQIGGTQTASPVSVSNGLFTLPLDFGAGVFAGDERYLEIKVRCPVASGGYVTLAPRQKLTAAPYALYAATAGKASGLSCGGCVTTSDLASGAVTGGTVAAATIQQSNLAFTPLLSVGASAPLASSGGQNPILSITGVLAVANGGTGGSTAAAARGALGAAASGANADITSLSGVTGNIALPASTASAGNILKAGVPFIHSFGNANTFMGTSAGNLTMAGGFNVAIGAHSFSTNAAGAYNTAVGEEALTANTTGTNNTAVGTFTLFNNNDGGDNTALGKAALQANIHGSSNTAIGANALFSNRGTLNTAVGAGALYADTAGVGATAVGAGALYANTADYNTAVGADALYANTADYNTAVGTRALSANTTGISGTAVGTDALRANTTGGFNVAVGTVALFSNTLGRYNTALGWGTLYWSSADNNTAVGYDALFSNTTGAQNTAMGVHALANSTSSNNIAIGSSAGLNVTTGGNNIEIGSQGGSADANTIRIGTSGTHTATFIAGISGATSGTGVAVYVNAGGHLGTTTSSARFKTDIEDVGDASSGLLKLRPVRFRYKPEIDPSGLEQYGLVAEEVARVYPDMVVYDDEGRPQSVRYHFVNAMLLNEVQKQARQIDALTARLAQFEAAIGTQRCASAPQGSHKAGPGF